MRLGYLASLSETRFPLGLLSLFLGPAFTFKGAEEGRGEGGGTMEGHTKQRAVACRGPRKPEGNEDTFSENIKPEEMFLHVA